MQYVGNFAISHLVALIDEVHMHVYYLLAYNAINDFPFYLKNGSRYQDFHEIPRFWKFA